MTLTIWTKGAPIYALDDEKKRDRLVWLQLHDQGGYPFVELGYLHGEHGPAFAEEKAAFIQWLRGPRKEPAPVIALIPWLNVPALKADDLLESWWNIAYHAELEVPPGPSEESA